MGPGYTFHQQYIVVVGMRMDDDIINDVAPDCAEKVGGCHLERRV